MINNSESNVTGSEVAVASSTNSDVAVVGPGTHIKKIWEDQVHIKKCERDGKKGWQCLWCLQFYVAENATKALIHVAKVWRPAVHVTRCPSKIPVEYLTWYRDLLKRNDDEKATKKRAQADIDADINANQEEATTMLLSKKKARRSAAGSDTSLIDLSADHRKPAASSARTSHQPTMESYTPAQPTNQSSVLESNEAACDTAIATMIHAANLPLTFGQNPLLKAVMFHARLVGPKYEAPSAHAVGGPLLDNNFEQVADKNKVEILKDADVFGLSVLGDGATIKKKPLFNVLASALNIPSAVLAVVDCSKHLAGGGKKDAEYIARCFLPHMEELDPFHSRIDLFIVDGASNVQKAGRVVAAVFPRVTVLHGAEHCLSLFFSDVAKIPQMRVSTNLEV